MTTRTRANTPFFVLPLLAAITLVGYDAGAQRPDDPAADAGRASTPAQATRTTPSPADTYEVNILGGPFAGSYRGTEPMNCMLEDGTWAADFSRERDRGVSALYVHLEGVQESGGSTNDATLMLTFGRLGATGGNSGGVGAGGPAGGSVHATAAREAGGAVIRIDAKTSYGAGISAVIRCPSEG